jgi:hypothetical protein
VASKTVYGQFHSGTYYDPKLGEPVVEDDDLELINIHWVVEDESCPPESQNVKYRAKLVKQAGNIAVTEVKATALYAETPAYITNELYTPTSYGLGYWRDKETGFTIISGYVSVGANNSSTFNYPSGINVTRVLSATITVVNSNPSTGWQDNSYIKAYKVPSTSSITITNGEGFTADFNVQIMCISDLA